jgi:tripartite-type tricarboxylate transporter receptor subunit TctC
MFAPAATPRAIVAKLNEDIARIVETPQMKEWLLNSLGGEFTPNTPEQFGAFLGADSAHWQKIVKEIGLQLD